MRQLIHLMLLLSFTFSKSLAQSTTITPGSVLPQMTSAQRTTLANPVNGMLVFDTNTNSYWFRQNTVWVELPKGGSTANYWQLDGLGGNEIKNTNSGGFWSENASTLDIYSSDFTNPPTVPVSGEGTRLMWIPSRSAFRVGSVTGNSFAWDAVNIGLFSFATGFDTRASGKYATAFGYGTNATASFSTSFGKYSNAMGNASVAMGESTKASGSGSLSFGFFSEATGNYAIAGGHGSKATGLYSVAFGTYTEATGSTSTALGHQTIASGNSSTSFGENTTASGMISTAFGSNTYAAGLISTSFGSQTESIGDYSLAMGFQTNASGRAATSAGSQTFSKAVGSFTVGYKNDDSDNPDPVNLNNTDRLFQIGNGTSSSRSNAMTVLRNGYVGLMNENSPVAPLHISNGPNSWERHIRLDYDPSSNEYGNIVYDFDGMKFRAWGTGDNFYFRNNANTSVAIMYESGNMTIAGTLTQNSDARLKKDLQKISNSSSKLAGLNAYHYHWKAEDRDQNQQTGLLAQEVQEVFPELVHEGEDGYLSVNYVGLIPHLIESHKELKAENEELRNTNQELLLRILEIEKKLDIPSGAQTASLK